MLFGRFTYASIHAYFGEVRFGQSDEQTTQSTCINYVALVLGVATATED